MTTYLETLPLGVTIGDPPWTSYAGACMNAIYQGYVNSLPSFDVSRSPSKFIPLNAVVITSETTLWTPATGRKFRLMGAILSMGTAPANVVVRDNTAGTTILILPKTPADTAFYLNGIGNGILSAAANNVLTAQGISTTTLSGLLYGTEE